MKKAKKIEKKGVAVKAARGNALMVWNFPEKLRQEMKIFCATHNTTIQEVVREAVQQYIA